MPTTATLTPAAIEAALDKRSTMELLGTLPFIPGDDYTKEWFVSPRYYPFYAGLASLVKPRRIMEIGVRLGYSLTSMFRGHGWIEGIVGFDNEKYIKGSNQKAFVNLRTAGYKGPLDIRLQDSREATFPDGMFDLVHVDGDHSWVGAYNDIVRSWKAVAPGGVIVVDDMKAANVEKAMADALTKLDGLAHGFGFETYRGAWIGVKEGT